MKKWIIRLLIVGVVVLLAALGILFFKLNAIVKTSVETIGSQLTKTEVKLGSASILPFTGGGELMALSVGNPAGYKSPTAIKVGGINVSVALGTILKDTVEIKSVKIRAPEITVEGGLFNNNLKEIQKNLHSPATASSGAGGSSSGKAGKKFYI
ncbi:MAG: hypothetical protein RLZZ350_1020, partial [Verrucomicrobiota bacterium]